MNGAITVVIPTFERAGVLARTLGSYVGQPSVEEVILVDDGGSEGNAVRLEELSSRYAKVRIVRTTKRGGQPAARMCGVGECGTRLVLLGEDDVILGETYCDVLASHARTVRSRLIAGAVIYLRPAEDVPVATVRYESQPPMAEVELDCALGYRSDLRLATDVLTPFLPGVMLVHMDVFDRVSFDSSYSGNAYREETDFTIRAWQFGMRPARCPHALCYHIARDEIAGGGQHRMPGWQYEISAIRNNWRFLSQHGDHLRAAHKVTSSNLALQLQFIASRARAAWRAMHS